MIIGVVGLIGSGKGTVGKLLEREMGYKQIAWADTLKDSVAVKFGWDREMLEGDTDESRAWREQPDAFWSSRFGRDFSPRYALQLEGTEAGRDVYHENLWVIATEKRIIENPELDFVITDCRFPNELDFVRKRHGHIIRVKRGPEPEWYDTAFKQNTLGRVEHPMSSMTKYHPEIHMSEWAWVGSKFDITIENDGSLEDLEENIRKFMLAL